MESDVAAADEELRRLNEKAFDEAGVDVTQIDLLLAMSPRERLQMLYECALSLARLMKRADADAD